MWTTDARLASDSAARFRPSGRGGALLAVLWLVAGLSAIAFAVASSVRADLERASTAFEALQCEYLAEGAIQRAILYLLWGPIYRNPDGSPRYWDPGWPRLFFRFPAGEAIVEVIPATAYLNLNSAPRDQLERLLLALGEPPDRARVVAAMIDEWRSPARPLGLLSQFRAGDTPSFRPLHASFEETEQLLLVPGVTRELFYGSWVRQEDGQWRPRPGLRDCLSVYGSGGPFDVNTVAAPVLLAVGVPPAVVEQIVVARQEGPIQPGPQLDALRRAAGEAGVWLAVGGRSIYTLRATARVRLASGQLSETRWTMAATVKLFGLGQQPPYQVLRWYPEAPAEGLVWP